VRCLTYIRYRNFAPGRSLVISSPSNYRDVQQEMPENHCTAIWPVVVAVDGNVSKRDETDLVDRDGSYGNIKCFHAEILGLYLD